MLILREVAVAALFLWMFIDGMFVFRLTTGKAENRDRFSLLVVLVGSMTALWVGIGLAFGAHSGSMPSTAWQIAGLGMLAIGIAVRSTAIYQLGRFHTPNVAVVAEHRIVDTGLYRHVRHPSYLGALIAYLGFSLALGNWLSLLVIMGVTPCVYLFRIHEEEIALAAAFGESYRAYCARTWKLLPGIH